MALEGKEEVTKPGSTISNGGGWAQLAAAMALVNRMTSKSPELQSGGGWAQLAAAMALAYQMTFEVTRASRVRYQIVREEICVCEKRIWDQGLRRRNDGVLWNS